MKERKRRKKDMKELWSKKHGQTNEMDDHHYM
jgi:hypothetical protein